MVRARIWLGLLALAACTPTTPADGSSESTGEGASTTSGSSTTASSGDPSASGTSTSGSSSEGSSSSSSSDTSTTGDDTTTSGSSSGSSSDDGSTTETGPNQACVDGCATEFECGMRWRSEGACLQWCEDNLVQAEVEAGPACRISWQSLYACLGTLTCEEYEQWQMPVAVPYPCIGEDEALTFECAGQ